MTMEESRTKQGKTLRLINPGWSRRTSGRGRARVEKEMGGSVPPGQTLASVARDSPVASWGSREEELVVSDAQGASVDDVDATARPDRATIRPCAGGGALRLARHAAPDQDLQPVCGRPWLTTSEVILYRTRAEDSGWPGMQPGAPSAMIPRRGRARRVIRRRRSAMRALRLARRR